MNTGGEERCRKRKVYTRMFWKVRLAGVCAMSVIVPGIQSGKILKATTHVAFPLLPAKEYGNVKLPAARYTADYVLKYADGTVEVVEIKSKFTRRQQRDYIYRRRLFIDLIAEPKGWKFTEIITPDTKSEINEWKKLARGMKRE